MSVQDRMPDFRAMARTVFAGLEYYGIIPPFSEQEHHVLPRLVKDGDTVLDIGANVGEYTCQLSRLVGPSGHVFAYEPYPPSFAMLSRLVRALGMANVTARDVALSDVHRTMRLARPKRAIGGTMHGFVHESTEWSPHDIEVAGHTLDEEVADLGLKSVDLIKCDVEGNEWKVIAGGLRTLREQRPVLICEIEERWAARYGQSRSDVIHEIQRLGSYRTFIAGGNELVPLGPDSLSGRNLIFVPET